MSSATGPQHLDDAALVRILDRQPLHDDDSSQLSGHLARCDDCRARYRSIERRDQALQGLLQRARPAEPAPPADLLERALETARRRARGPRRRADSPLLRAAAVAAILFAGALTAEPVREWLGATARQLMAALAPLTPPPPATPITPAPSADDAVEVTIVPAGDRLVLRFDAAEPGAVARIRFQERVDASGQILGNAPAPGLVALTDGFRVRNAGVRGTHYRFTVPAGMPVEIRIGDRVAETLRGRAGQEREVTLERRQGS